MPQIDEGFGLDHPTTMKLEALAQAYVDGVAALIAPFRPADVPLDHALTCFSAQGMVSHVIGLSRAKGGTQLNDILTGLGAGMGVTLAHVLDGNKDLVIASINMISFNIANAAESASQIEHPPIGQA